VLNWMPSFLLRSGTSRLSHRVFLELFPSLGVQITYDATGTRRHFVTSFSTQQMSAGQLHADLLSQRRDGKPHQRTSTRFVSATVLPPMSLRAINSGCGFPLCQCKRRAALSSSNRLATALRQHHPPQTPQGGKSRISVRRVVIAISSYWTGQSLFAHVYQQLQQVPRSG